MEYFDLHCDTLYKAVTTNSSFDDNSNHISIKKAESFEKWTQLFAIWIPDEIKGEYAKRLFLDAVNTFQKERIYNERINMMLAVENGSMLCGKIENIELLKSAGVRYVTLTWNAENEIGGGAQCQGVGLSDFGKEVVKELQRNNIAVDISHASDKLFYDVIKVSTKPVIATHSNSRYVTDVMRNLTDEQFKIIRDQSGLVGINLYKGFLNNDPEKACTDDVVRHVEHFLNLDGENTLAIGADFDGADMPYDIKGIESIPSVFERFLFEFGTNITKKIFSDNANLYFTNFDNN